MKKLVILALSLSVIAVGIWLFLFWSKKTVFIKPNVVISLSSVPSDDRMPVTFVLLNQGRWLESRELTYFVTDETKTDTGLSLTLEGPKPQPIDPGFSIGQGAPKHLSYSVEIPLAADRFTLTLTLDGKTDSYTIERDNDQLNIGADKNNSFSKTEAATIPVFPENTLYAYCKMVLTQNEDTIADQHCTQFFAALTDRFTPLSTTPAFQSQLTIAQRNFGQWWEYSGSVEDLTNFTHSFADPNYDLLVSNGNETVTELVRDYDYNTDNTASVFNPLDSPGSFSFEGKTLTIVPLPLEASITLPADWKENPLNSDDATQISFLTHGFNVISFWAVPVLDVSEEDDVYLALVNRYFDVLHATKIRNESVMINDREWHLVGKTDSNNKLKSDPSFVTQVDDQFFIVTLYATERRNQLWDIGKEIVGQITFP